MAFSQAQKVDIRRYCGYPAYGGPQSAGFQEWRFFQAYGVMEFRLNNLDPTEETVVLNYVTQLLVLEAAIPASGPNLDTDTAAVFKRNLKEVRDRQRLYSAWRRELCGFLGVPPGPALGTAGLSLVV